MGSTNSRRHFLGAAGVGLLGAGLGYGLREALSSQPAPTGSHTQIPDLALFSSAPQEVAHAVSLGALQRQLRQANGRADSPERVLVGLNRIFGFVTDAEGDVILYGQAASGPPIETDCLVVALRNAYKVSPVYNGAPGCTINPRPGDDPWTIQRVRVFGMPANCRMAARHVALDYELKKIGAAVIKEPEIRSAFEILRTSAVCEERQDRSRSVVHRYWFYPLLPPAPRFERGEGAVRILAPTGVQLLTEQEFLDRRGERTGATEATPEAQEFAAQVTAALAGGKIPRYVRLVNDFRVVELAKLMRYMEVPVRQLAYFLESYDLEDVDAPRFVGGIIRKDEGMAICDAAITERPGAIECQQSQTTYRYEYRGGVEVRIELQSNDIREADSELSLLRDRILTSRPTRKAVSWDV